MAQTIKIKRGLQSAVNNLVLSPGEFAVATDTGNVYIGVDSGKIHVNPPDGDAQTAKKLFTAREFKLAGDVTSPAVTFDGSQNVTLNAQLAAIAGLTAGEYAKVIINNKGQVVGVGTLTEADIPTINKNKVSGLGTAAGLNVGTTAGSIVQLDSSGKIPESLIPPVAIVDTFVAANETEMLALTAQKGDVAVRTDIGKTYILKNTPASTLSNWQEMATPASDVRSVNGMTGNVSLNAGHVGAEPIIKNAAAKTSVVDADTIAISDSAANSATKKLAFSVLKSTLKSYFDTLYNKYTLPTATANTLGGVKVGTSMAISNGILDVGNIDGGTF